MSNLQYSPPVIGRDFNTDMGVAIQLDEAALGQTSTSTFVDIALTALPTPPTPTATFSATGTAGTTSYSYFVADIGNAGTVAPSATVTNTVGNTALSATNSMTLAWTGTAGHTYNLVRSAGGSNQGTIYTVTLPTTNSINPVTGFIYPLYQAVSFVDTGGVTATGNLPSVNTTGSISAPGSVLVNGTVALGCNVQSISTTATTGQLTPANLLNQLLVVAGGTVNVLTMPTAAVLVAALPGIRNSTGFKFAIRNSNTGSVTLATTTGVTSAAGNTLALVSINTREYFIQFTNVTPGSESYSFYTGPAAAY